MTDIIPPKLNGSSDSETVSLYRYTEDIRLSLESRLTRIEKQLEAIKQIIKGGS